MVLHKKNLVIILLIIVTCTAPAAAENKKTPLQELIHKLCQSKSITANKNTDKEKYQFLYNQIIADATAEEKTHKFIALVAAWYLAYAEFGTYQLSSATVPLDSNKKQLIDLICYTIFYTCVVQQQRMSKLLACSGAATSYYFYGQTRALICFWILSCLFLKTTKQKLCDFLNCDQDQWNERTQLIPRELLQEFNELHTLFLQYNTIKYPCHKLDHLLKKIIDRAGQKKTTQ